MRYKGTTGQSLESFKFFPYIAWTLTIGFTFFVYHLATELKAVSEDLERQTKILQAQVNTPPGQIIDFEKEDQSE